MDSLLKDLRFGFRMLVKQPTLALIAIVTFTLGIGLTTTVFSIVNGALYRGLPFEESERIAWVHRNNPSENQNQMGVTVPDYFDWRARQSAFESMAAMSFSPVNLALGEGRPERFAGASFTAEMLDVLNLQPILGRGFREGEDRPGAEPVIMIGYDLWQDCFGGSREILGETVRANGVTRTVVGVMPEGFGFPLQEQVWLPLELDPSNTDRSEGPRYTVVGRLNPSTSLDEAKVQMASIASRLAQEFPESNEGIGVEVKAYTERFLGPEIYGLLYTMLGAALGVLIIACVNVTNLLLARASVRTREVTVRAALGASRVRLIQQLLIEVMILALIGGTIGVGLAYFGVEWFTRSLESNPPPFWMVFELDFPVLIFVVAVTSLSALVSGLAPALKASGSNIVEALKDEGRGSSSLSAGRFTGGLVIAEVAVSCGLLIAAGLMISSVAKLRTVDLPFATENVFTARINLPVLTYPDTTSRLQFYAELLPKLEAIPGVEAATLSDGLPASGNGSRVFQVEGESYAAATDYPSAREGIVTPGYFRTFRTEVLQGRAFSVNDHTEALPVAIVNRTFVQRFFLEGDPLGRRIRMGREDTDAEWLTIVGVVPDMRMEGFGSDDASPAGFYITIAQSGVGNFVSIAAYTQGRPMAVTTAVRETVMSVDSTLPIFDVYAMTTVVENTTWFYRVFGTLFMAFGAAALFLASVGLYGVMSFAVARRTQEMGIRMAMGAQGSELVKLMMKKGIVQLVVGLVIGLGTAALAAGPLQFVLFEVNARDPMVFGAVVAVLAGVGVLASFIPARRVTTVNPVTALTPE